jgi:predicted alpha/beta superfamily hydrolase
VKGLLLGLFYFLCLNASGQIPKVSNGIINHYENFKSNYVTARTIDVWLPEGYNEKQKYAVLYMHDGKGLYDSSIMWNNQEWGVDETMTKLLREKKIKNCIVVGIWNSEASRHLEYFPQKPFESLTKTQQDSIFNSNRSNGQSVFKENKLKSDNYLKFIVKELKPFIDKNFSTLKNQKNTFIAGSSMGGLISIYAICEYPTVFGGAACLSTHWPGIFSVEGNPIPDSFYRYLNNNLPNPATHKIYFDYGDQTLDALYPPLQKRVDEIMQSKRFTKKTWVTRFFPEEGHSEKAWSNRLDVPLLFLLKE